MQVLIEQDGVLEIARAWRELAGRAEDLVPAGQLVRDRLIESERRLFAQRPWAPKKASTRKRYRYPIAHFAAGGTIKVDGNPDGPPLELSGTLERTLKRAHAIGQRDSIRPRKGSLDVLFGVRATGPVAYGNFQTDRHGAREARNPIRFDTIAHTDATGDVLQFVMNRRRR